MSRSFWAAYLHCTVQDCIALRCTVLQCTAPVQHSTVLHCTALHCKAFLDCSTCTAVCCAVQRLRTLGSDHSTREFFSARTSGENVAHWKLLNSSYTVCRKQKKIEPVSYSEAAVGYFCHCARCVGVGL